MISSQKGREFVNSNYNDIKRVYSIWVCMNMSQNCMNYIHFTQESVVGTYQWKGDIDLANIVLITSSFTGSVIIRKIKCR